MPDKLPPLPKEALDGESERTELIFKKCTHKEVRIVGNELRCKCNAGWSGTNIHALYEALRGQS